MGKPNYRVVVSFDPQRTVFLARAPELEHLTGEGASRKDAIAKLEEEIDAQLANVLSQGGVPPKAVDEIEHSGEVTAKISKSLHRDLAYLARSEGVELDQVVSELLAASLAMRQQGRRALKGGSSSVPADDVGNRIDQPRQNNADGNRADGNRRPYGGGRGGNGANMDDRAQFIEYVRGLEQGGGQAHRGGGQRPRDNNNGGGGNGGGGNNNNRRRRGGRGPGDRAGQPAQHGPNRPQPQARPPQPAPATPPTDSHE